MAADTSTAKIMGISILPDRDGGMRMTKESGGGGSYLLVAAGVLSMSSDTAPFQDRAIVLSVLSFVSAGHSFHYCKYLYFSYFYLNSAVKEHVFNRA